MALSFSRPDPTSPASVADARFPTVRRGYDPAEVRDLLVRVAAELGRLNERERFLQHELRVAQEQVIDPRELLDDDVVVRLLGEETLRVLQTARESAGQIKSRAEEAAARLLREASEEADRIRAAADADAARIRADATADAEAEVSLAKQQGREMVNEARAYRERVLSELSRRRDAARQQIEQLASGRDRLVQAFERARLAAVDVIDGLSPLDEPDEYVNLAPTTGPVPLMVPRSAPPTARPQPGPVAEPEPAVEPEPVVADVEGEPEIEVEAALEPEAEPVVAEAALEADVEGEPEIEVAAALEADVEAEPEVAQGQAEGPAVEPEPAVPEAEPEVAHDEPEVAEAEQTVAEPDAAAGPVMVEPEPEYEPEPVVTEPVVTEAVVAEAVVAEAGTLDAEPAIVEPEPEVAETEPEALDAEPEVAEPEAEVLDAEPEIADPEAGVAVAAAPGPVAETSSAAGRGNVVSLFARLRAETSEVAEVASDAADSDEGGEVGGDDVAVDPGATVDDRGSTERHRETDVEAGTEGRGETELSSIFTTRDEALAPLVTAAARRLKRVLADEQNDVLGRLSQAEPVVELDDLVPGAAEHAGGYAMAIDAEVRAAAAAGAASIGDVTSVADHHLVAVAELIADGLVMPLRARLHRAVVDGSGANDEIGRTVRAIYREWKVTHIDAQLGDVLRLAHGTGVLAASTPGRPMCWKVDPAGPPCPDAEDNALAGIVPAGEPYPTGHRTAPAHPGCRCLISPAAN